MPKPVAIAQGIAIAFPDVCKTPTPGGPIPIPYPNIVRLDQASAVTDAGGKQVTFGGQFALLQGAEIAPSSGDEPGSVGGVKSGTVKGMCVLTGASSSVVYGPEAKGIVRFLDQTTQNDGNAAGVVLSAYPRVLVGD